MTWLELDGRTYALRFTVRAILRTQERVNAPFSTLFHSGRAGLCALLYCALCEDAPALTLSQAAALYEKKPLSDEALGELLLKTLLEDGFDREGVTREALQRLESAAVRAAYPQVETLAALSVREIHNRLTSFLAARGYVAPAMREEDMRQALLSFARRYEHDNP